MNGKRVSSAPKSLSRKPVEPPPSKWKRSVAVEFPRATSASARSYGCSSSSVRACTPTARDSCARSSDRSTSRKGTPNDASCAASASPVGPAPTMTTAGAAGRRRARVRRRGRHAAIIGDPAERAIDLRMHPSDRGPHDHARRGVFLALVAATLFGISAPFSKLLLHDATPQLFAGLLYLGSGAGLALFWLGRRARGRSTNPLTRRDVPWLAGAILCRRRARATLPHHGDRAHPRVDGVAAAQPRGGVHGGPRLVRLRRAVPQAHRVRHARHHRRRRRAVVGRTRSRRAASSARCSSRHRRSAGGSTTTSPRRVSSGDALQLGMLKGLVAGSVNTGLALALGATWPGGGASRRHPRARPRVLRREPRAVRPRAPPHRRGAHGRVVLDRPLHRDGGVADRLPRATDGRVHRAAVLMAIGVWLLVTETQASTIRRATREVSSRADLRGSLAGRRSAGAAPAAAGHYRRSFTTRDAESRTRMNRGPSLRRTGDSPPDHHREVVDGENCAGASPRRE